MISAYLHGKKRVFIKLIVPTYLKNFVFKDFCYKNKHVFLGRLDKMARSALNLIKFKSGHSCAEAITTFTLSWLPSWLKLSSAEGFRVPSGKLIVKHIESLRQFDVLCHITVKEAMYSRREMIWLGMWWLLRLRLKEKYERRRHAVPGQNGNTVI